MSRHPRRWQRLRRGVLPWLVVATVTACSVEPPADSLTGLRRPGDATVASAPGGTATGGTDDAAPTGGSTEAEPAPGGRLDGLIGEPLPMQHYVLSGRDYDTVMQALRVLRQQCMDAQGFDVELPPPHPAWGPVADLRFRAYGSPETLADAREVAWGIPARAGAPDEPGDDDLDARLTDAERAALGGTEEEWREAAKEGRRAGCTGEADRLLMGDASVIEASGVKTPDLVREVLWDPRSTDSPASREATAAYIACMTRAGYPGLPDTYEQPEQFRTEDLQRPSEAAKQAAVAMFHCFEETRVREAMAVADFAFQTNAIEENPEAFAQIRKELDDVIRRATEVLAEGDEG